MKKLFFLIFAFLFIFALIVPSLTLADGMIFPPPDYFMNESEQKAVIVYEQGRETLILSITFAGDAKDFGWVIPTPSRPEIDKSSDEIFTSLTDLTAPQNQVYRGIRPGIKFGAPVKEEVTIIETKKVDIYEITTLTAEDHKALSKWLSENGYQFPEKGAYILDEYVQNNWFFVACKIRTEVQEESVTKKLNKGHATPLKIVFDSEKIIYPLKISSLLSLQQQKAQEKKSKQQSKEWQEEIAPVTGPYWEIPKNVHIILYVFTDGKKELPGFTQDYANWIKPEQIKKLAFVDGKPWFEPKKRFYLTRLSNYMEPEEMTEDLILRSSEDNKTINAPAPTWQKILLGVLYFLLFLVVYILSPIGLIFLIGSLLQFLTRSKKIYLVAWILQAITLFASLVAFSWILIIGIISGQVTFESEVLIACLAVCLFVIACMIVIMILQAKHHKKQKTQSNI